MKRPIKMRLLMMLSSLVMWGQEVGIVGKPTQPMGYCHTQWHGPRRTSHPVWLGKRWRRWCFWELHTSTWHTNTHILEHHTHHQRHLQSHKDMQCVFLPVRPQKLLRLNEVAKISQGPLLFWTFGGPIAIKWLSYIPSLRFGVNVLSFFGLGQ